MTVLDFKAVPGRRRKPAGPRRARFGDRAVLFDLDGLLVDTEPLGQMAERAVMRRLGSSVTPRETAELTGASMGRTVEILLARAEEPLPPEEVAALLETAMLELVRQHGAPVLPGARELLAGVRAQGLPHALVTSTGLVLADAIMRSAGLAFPVVVTGDHVTAAKPDPQPYQQAAALLGIAPAYCVALEDSPQGVASARAAGCRVIAVPSTSFELPSGVTKVASLTGLRAGRHGLELAC